MSQRVILWKCPKPTCGFENAEDVDPITGPFVFCTCSLCGGEFSQREVNAIEGEV